MDVQRLIGEVARRHNVLVDSTDPIFLTVTLNELLLSEHVQKLQVALEQASRGVTAASSLQADSAKRVAEDLKRIRASLEEAARNAAASAARYEEEKRDAARMLVDAAREAAHQMRATGSAIGKDLDRYVPAFIELARISVTEAAHHRRISEWSAGVALSSAILILGTVMFLWIRAS
jgi:uncharacterized membrane protein YdbT with pleckstrin-like domain